MTYLRPIIFFRKKTGIIITLFFTALCFLRAETPAENFKKLGDIYEEYHNTYLSYVNNLSAYHLEADPVKKRQAGVDALKACIRGNRLTEGVQLIDSLSTEKSLSWFEMYRGLLFLKNDMGEEAEAIVSQYRTPELDLPWSVLSSYSFFLQEEYQNAATELLSVENSSWSEETEVIRKLLMKENPVKEKNRYLALGLSALLPGAGQVYTEMYFDAANTFTFNSILGAATWVLWEDVLEQEASERNYSLPVISSAVFAVFYVSNLYNSFNSADRYNNYHKSRYYDGVLDRFQLLLKDEELFFSWSITF